jgi:hypothetical protein
MFIKSQYVYIGGNERMKVSRTRKEKLETGTDTSLQIVTNATEESAVTAADIEVSSEKRKKDADKPLYLKRI